MLGVSESELGSVLEHVEHCQAVPGHHKSATRVTFQSDSVTHVSSFLSCFTCRTHVGEGGQTGTGAITLNKDLSDEKKRCLGNFFLL